MFGGVSAKRLSDTSCEIRAAGNGRTPDDSVGDYAILKAAEETVAARYQSFRVIKGIKEVCRHVSGPLNGGFVYIYNLMIEMYQGPRQNESELDFDVMQTARTLGAKHNG